MKSVADRPSEIPRPRSRVSDSTPKAKPAAWSYKDGEEASKVKNDRGSMGDAGSSLEEMVFLGSPSRSIHRSRPATPSGASTPKSNCGGKPSPIVVLESPAKGPVSPVRLIGSPVRSVRSVGSPVRSLASPVKSGRETPSDVLESRASSSRDLKSPREVKSEISITSESKTEEDYKLNIRRRIQNAKERVGVPARMKNNQRKKSPLPKTEPITEEDKEVEEAMKRHKEARNKWKHLSRVTKQISSLEAEFDFFMRGAEESFDKDTHDAKSLKDESSDDEEVKLMQESKEWGPDVFYSPAVPTDWDQLKLKQQGIYFCPSSSPVPIEEKLEPNTLPRFMEEEGLYVTAKTNVSWRSKNKTEQRIMAAGSERLWFGEDGELKCLAEPLSYTCVRLPTDEPISEELQVQYKPPVLLGKSTEVLEIKDANYILEVDVGEVSFHQHPLFTKEHHLAQNLKCLTNTLDRREKDGIVNRLYGKLQALRNSKIHSEELYQRDQDDIHKYRITTYKREINRVRNEWLSEGKTGRELLTRVLETWRDLKRLRLEQGFSLTSVKLDITELQSRSDNNLWNRELPYLIKELEEEEMEEYKKRKQEYKQKILEIRQRHNLENDSEDDWSEEGREESLLSEPRRPNPHHVAEKAKRLLADSMRPPNEPPLILGLSELDGPPPYTQFMADYEKEFSKGVWVGLKYNGREVGRARGIEISKERPSFSFMVKHRFSVRLSSKPRSVSLQIICPKRAASQPLAHLYLPLPPRLKTDEVSWQDYEWSGEWVGGSETRGSVSIRSGWGQDIPHSLYLDSANQGKLTKLPEIDRDKLKEWLELSQLDPNDPSHVEFFLQVSEGGSSKKESEGFCLNPGQKEFDFCTDRDLVEDPRLKLLMLRDRGEPEFRNMRNVPIRSKQIPPDIFKGYERRISGRGGAPSGGNRVGGGPFDVARAKGRRMLEEVRAAAAKQVQLSQHLRTKADMVIEQPVSDISGLFNSLMKWLQPKRPLRPTRKERKKIPFKSLVGQNLEIVVTVIRAMQVPVRTECDKVTSMGDGVSLLPVRPFVEITFQGNRQRTFTADGPNPTWNQELRLPIRVSGDLNNLHTIKESIFCHLYDEPVIDLIEDERERETNVHHRLERHWLASLRIPFSALYANARIEGSFQLYSPPVMIGYERESKDLHNKTFLTLLVTIQPPLHTPHTIKERVESSEEPQVENHLREWEKSVRRDLPNRNFACLVISTTGKSVSATRFISPIKPPVIIEGQETTPEMAARFVSLIPTVTGSSTFPGIFDIWLTADQVVKGVCGERVDKAVLLACYLTDLGFRAWLCLGQGLPHGPSAWVVSRDPQAKESTHVWDPDTGLRYSYMDPFCPLHKLHCLVDPSNIWVNEDKDDVVRSGRLDLREWRCAFGRHQCAPVGSVQPRLIEYTQTSLTDARLLQDKLEKLLRDAVMKLRPTHRTVWNRYCSSSLRKLLPSLEEATWQTTPKSPDHLTDLNHIISSHKMCGFPINLPYTSSTELVEAVKATGVHLNDSPDIEFALAVYIHPYPSNVLSVWIYVASLVRRR